jgi:prepilin-type N-terminal cleavage/methylation domain-containing protein
MCRSSVEGTRKGFTLIELAVVIVIIGVLAAFGVPRFMKSVERSKAAEAFNYLSAVRDAEERFQAREGTYTSDLTSANGLDIAQSAPKYFTVESGSMSADQTSWELKLTRVGSSSGYTYNVIFNENGYCTSSTINGFPEINPMGTEVTSSGG